jgi:hypothetical protein
MTKAVYNIIPLCLSILYATSCAQYGRYHGSFRFEPDLTTPDYAIPPSGGQKDFDMLNERIHYTDSYMEGETIREEEGYIKMLNEKMNSSPSSMAKYKQKLNEFKNQLQTKYKNRTHARLLFLQKFYSDLYQLTNQDFTKKYKKHCSRDILDELKYKYRLHHGKKGYAWTVFTDNEKHAPSEFRFTYLDGNPEQVADKYEALFMFGDSVRHKEPEYRYTNAEDKWYRVSMGRHYVMVQVEGEGKDMLVTGISNPYTRTSVKKQREKWHYFKLL